MPLPAPYARDYSFTGFQAGNPTSPLPGPKVDQQFDEIANNLAGIIGGFAQAVADAFAPTIAAEQVARAAGDAAEQSARVAAVSQEAAIRAAADTAEQTARQLAIAAIQAQLIGLSQGSVSDGSISTAKMADNAATLAKVGADVRAAIAANNPNTLTPAQLNAIAGQTLYGTNNLTSAVLNAITGQTLYGSNNLNANVLNAIAGQTIYGSNTLNANVLNAIAGQTLYGSNNLNPALIAAILGYVPARPTQVFSATTGGLSDINVNTRQYLNAVDFVAQSASALVTAGTSFVNNTSGAVGYDGYLGISVLDMSNGSAEVGAANEARASVTYGQGFACATACLPLGGLTLGHTYRVRPYVLKTSTGAAIGTTATTVSGVNL